MGRLLVAVPSPSHEQTVVSALAPTSHRTVCATDAADAVVAVRGESFDGVFLAAPDTNYRVSTTTLQTRFGVPHAAINTAGLSESDKAQENGARVAISTPLDDERVQTAADTLVESEGPFRASFIHPDGRVCRTPYGCATLDLAHDGVFVADEVAPDWLASGCDVVVADDTGSVFFSAEVEPVIRHGQTCICGAADPP